MFAYFGKLILRSILYCIGKQILRRTYTLNILFYAYMISGACVNECFVLM